MKCNAAGLALIRTWERLELTAYRSGVAGDVLTIGYGHTRDVHEGQTITAHQAEVILQSDAESFEEELTSRVPATLTENQFSALVDFVFNEGITRFTGSHLQKALYAGDMALAEDELLRWEYSKGVVVEGLENRRKAERELFCTP